MFFFNFSKLFDRKIVGKMCKFIYFEKFFVYYYEKSSKKFCFSKTLS